MILHHADILMASHLRIGDVFYTSLDANAQGLITSIKPVAGGTVALTYSPLDDGGHAQEQYRRRLSIPGDRLMIRVVD